MASKVENYEKRIDKAGFDNIETIITDLENAKPTSAFPAKVKEELLIKAHGKRNALEAEAGKSQEKIDEAKKEQEENDKYFEENRKKTVLPSKVKKVENVTDEQVQDFQNKKKLFGHDPVKKIAYIIPAILIALGMLFSPVSEARDTTTDKAVLGDSSTGWAVQSDGDLVPNTTNSYDIGSASYYPAQIYLGGVAKSSWGSIVSPWEDDGTSVTLTSAPTKFVGTIASGDWAATGFTAGASDITLENGQVLDGGTNNAFKFTENSDTLSFTASGNDWVVDSTDGGVIFTLTDATDGTVDIMTNNDSDDYIQVSTTTNQPLINFVGCNGKITAASGTIDFDDEAITTTGTLSAGAITGTSFIVGDDTVDVVTDDIMRFASNDENSTIEAYGYEAKDAIIQITADQGDDNGDTWQIVSNQSGNALTFKNDTTGSQAVKLTLDEGNGNLTLTGDIINENADTIVMSADDVIAVTSNDEAMTFEVEGYEAKDAKILLDADEGDDNADSWWIVSNQSGNALTVLNHTSTYLTVAAADGDITTAGDVEIIDDMDLVLGSGGDIKIQYDEATDDQCLFVTTTTGATATTDPLFEFLVPTSPTADQQVFGVAKGSQATNTVLLTVDEDGDAVVTGDLTVTGQDIVLGSAGVKLTDDGDGAVTLLGQGDGNDEDFTMNLDDTANQVVCSSSTGVTTFDFGTINVGTDAVDVSDGDITNVGDIAVDTITSDATTVVTINDGLVGLVDEITATDAGVAASLTTVITEITTNGDSDLDNVTLANGTSGQIKIFIVVVEGNASDTVKVTPATMLEGTQITFDGTVGQGCTMVYADSEGWCVVGNNGGTIA